MFPRCIIIILAACCGFLFNACTNKLDVTAPYKDTTIVYGMLSPTDSVQYIKIYKAFIGDGNAFEYAQSADSFYFKDVIEMYIMRLNKNIISDTTMLHRTTIQPMEPGVFASAPNIVYSTRNSIIAGGTYRLSIKNKTTGSEVTSETGIPGIPQLYEPGSLSKVIGIAGASRFGVNWLSGIHAKVYNVVIRFNYTEFRGGIPTQKYLDWEMGKKIVKDQLIPEILDVDKESDDFYKLIASKVSAPDSITYRIAGKIDLLLYAAGEDYYYYQKINNATVGVSQSIPQFTNIQNGLGFFSSKYVSRWSYNLDDASYNYLIHGIYTAGLGFY